jgi:hypothetical protein
LQNARIQWLFNSKASFTTSDNQEWKDRMQQGKSPFWFTKPLSLSRIFGPFNLAGKEELKTKTNRR